MSVFAYRGQADSVRFSHPGLRDDLWFAPLEPERRWWVLCLAIPAGSRLEYRLAIDDLAGSRRILDPLNPVHVPNPFGGDSVCEAAGYTTPRFATPDPHGSPGSLVDHVVESAAFDRTTRTQIYLSAGVDSSDEERHPLVVVLDGPEYLQYGSLATVFDNLVGSGLIPPSIVAFSEPGDRFVEYAADARLHQHLVDELVPALERDLPCGTAPERRVLIGASFGAVAALSTAASSPNFFGRLLLQSGSFAGAGTGCKPRPEPMWEPIHEFVRGYVRQPATVAAKVGVTCGVYESLRCENRALAPVLEGTGMDTRFVEHLDGHNFTSWRDAAGAHLPWLLEP